MKQRGILRMNELEKVVANLKIKTLSENIECNECRAENETLLKYMKNYKKLCKSIQSLCCKKGCNNCPFSTGTYDCFIYDDIEWSGEFKV